MKKYLSITKNMFQTAIAWRFHFFMMSIANIVYLIFLYFLWNAIFDSATTEKLNGMTFVEVFIYMALVSSVVVLFKTWTEWEMSSRILNGNIIMDLLKPLDLQATYFFRSIGGVLFNTITITLPVMIVLYFIWGGQLNSGAYFLWFVFSVILAYIISYLIDFITGVVSFYTESIWGVSIAKETVILFLAGAVVPIQFFPESMQRVLYFLPFQAIYYTPISFLTNKEINSLTIGKSLLIQVGWIIVLVVISRVFYNKALKTVTVNGG